MRVCVRIRPSLACETTSTCLRIKEVGISHTPATDLARSAGPRPSTHSRDAISCAASERESRQAVDLARGAGQSIEVVSQSPLRAPEAQRFVFSRVLGPDTGQAEVFRACALPLLDAALIEGRNATLLAYGQTGSGKTHSVFGSCEVVDGVVPRLVCDLFTRLDTLDVGHGGASVKATLIELYNDAFYDLLAPEGRVQLEWHMARTTQLSDATTMSATDPAVMIAVIQDAMARRAHAATALNVSSSRSHAILTLHFSGVKLIIVDLAGSERVKRSGVSGTRFVETVHINSSLLGLAAVVSALVADRGRPAAHIPYRDSPLTTLLADSLGGSACTSLLACVSPAIDSASETAATLRFAASATWVNSSPAPPKKSLDSADQRLVAETARVGARGIDIAALAAAASRITAAALFTSDACGIADPITMSLGVGGGARSVLALHGDFRAGPSAPLIVCLHYYGAGSAGGAYWRPWFDPLVNAGWRVLAPSFPGHGASPGPPLAAKPEPAVLGQAPCALLLALLDALGESTAAVLGLDWGGGLALEFSLLHPTRVTHMITWAASYRDADNGARLRTLPRRLSTAHGGSPAEASRSRLSVLWSRRDAMHSYKRGEAIAAALGAPLVDCNTDAAACLAVTSMLGRGRSSDVD